MSSVGGDTMKTLHIAVTDRYVQEILRVEHRSWRSQGQRSPGGREPYPSR